MSSREGHKIGCGLLVPSLLGPILKNKDKTDCFVPLMTFFFP